MLYAFVFAEMFIEASGVDGLSPHSKHFPPIKWPAVDRNIFTAILRLLFVE